MQEVTLPVTPNYRHDGVFIALSDVQVFFYGLKWEVGLHPARTFLFDFFSRKLDPLSDSPRTVNDPLGCKVGLRIFIFGTRAALLT